MRLRSSALPQWNFRSDDFSLANRNLWSALFQGNQDSNHKLWNVISTERYILHMQVLLKCCYIWMESSQWENWNHLFCRKVSFAMHYPCYKWPRICSTPRKNFPVLSTFGTRLTQRVTLVEQELLFLPEHLSLVGFVLLWGSLVLCVMFCRSLFLLSVLLRFTNADYYFGILKFLLGNISWWNVREISNIFFKIPK